ncbi:chorismate mutase [Kineosporia rhizophila]|uniref:chorismate mutase n=1 Tax=Kineosporia TaxID=49184 RepID=UPI001E2ABB7D|nr:chorismate mutase [Kineosporia sp. NBRC 101677]MCE0539375.1 chorismate mutase [Kineosporia rhizophila]GLY19876.1 chorismate mutase [Kineosporia sp. NBRC 101677]
MAVRAVRGATQIDTDERDHVLERTREMVSEVMVGNQLDQDSIISIVFTATQDVKSVAPALAARQLGLNDPALICVQEMHVEGAMPMLVRLVAHVETDLAADQIRNVYLHGTERLRTGVPPIPLG